MLVEPIVRHVELSLAKACFVASAEDPGITEGGEADQVEASEPETRFTSLVSWHSPIADPEVGPHFIQKDL